MRDVQLSFPDADAAPTPEERIEALVRSAFRIVQGNQSFWRLSYGSRMQTAVLEAPADRVPQWTTQIRRTLSRYFREAGAERPELEATLLFALVDGAVQHFVLDSDGFPEAEVRDAIVRAYRRSPRRELFTGSAGRNGA